MRKAILAALAMVLAAGCGGGGGGSSSGGGTPGGTTCAPSGSYTISDTRGAGTGFCTADADLATNVAAVTVTVSGSTFTWNEDGTAYTGVLNTGTCVATVTAATQIAAGADIHGNPIVVDASIARSVTFSGNNVAGTATLAITSGTVLGTPCTANYTSTGTRH